MATGSVAPLPFDMMCEIASHLPLSSVATLERASKQFSGVMAYAIGERRSSVSKHPGPGYANGVIRHTEMLWDGVKHYRFGTCSLEVDGRLVSQAVYKRYLVSKILYVYSERDINIYDSGNSFEWRFHHSGFTRCIVSKRNIGHQRISSYKYTKEGQSQRICCIVSETPGRVSIQLYDEGDIYHVKRREGWYLTFTQSGELISYDRCGAGVYIPERRRSLWSEDHELEQVRMREITEQLKAEFEKMKASEMWQIVALRKWNRSVVCIKP